MENILLVDLTRHAEIHTEFARTNRTQSKHVNWGKEKPQKPDGMRCNFPVTLCELEPTIPADQGTAAKKVPKKIFMDKEETGKWIDKHLTTALHEYKGNSKIVTSETSKYKVARYYEYLPTSVFTNADKHQES